MSELQSCATLVNAAALCGRSRGCSLEFSAASASLNCEEQEEKDENVNVVSKISAELQRERQRNMELMKRISLLEAQLQERAEQNDCPTASERIFKKFKRQKIEPRKNDFEDLETAESNKLPLERKNRTPCIAIEDATQQDCLVNWMGMDDASFLNFEKFRNGDLTADCEDTDESEDDGDEFYVEHETEVGNNDKKNDDEVFIDNGENTQYLERPPCDQSEPTFLNPSKEINENVLFPNARFISSNKEFSKHKGKESKRIKGCKILLKTVHYGKEIVHEGTTSVLSNKKPLKVPFCPKEIKRILGSEELLLRNAQAHTIRKIIVFASLGIWHGCEDLYELDFNHFSILQKGEPYVSPKNPGEHVLYEHPGVRRKIFYPNRQNPTLCPVQILEEEKAMRPSDLSCPSYLFLCIKCGGRTRNLPQNEYVRQRMGRNKLKSFGPLMCRLAMLVHIRSGSFFFKALGITLLFMAGFSDDLVQRETKYRNWDLLQKYYRIDEEAKGEELFHSDSMLIDAASPDSKQLTAKATTKLGSKKQKGSSKKSQNSPVSSVTPSTPCSSSQPPTQFGLTRYASLQSSMQPPSTADITISNTSISTSMPGILPSCHSGRMTQTPTPYPNFPQNAANMFMPMVYWPHASAFPSFPYSTSYGYRSFPHSGNYISFQPPQPYYGHPPFMPRVIEGAERKDLAAMEDTERESDSSSSSTKEGISKS